MGAHKSIYLILLLNNYIYFFVNGDAFHNNEEYHLNPQEWQRMEDIMDETEYSVMSMVLLMSIGNGYHFPSDKACRARRANDSVVCVCTADYCDEITREVPQTGQYFAYTSSQGGLRFSKSTGSLQNSNSDNRTDTILVLDPTIQYQSIQGFGGGVTDTVGINWVALKNETLQHYLINSYFGATGIEYNIIRTPIGGSDFSIRPYTLQDYPENDASLSNFSLAYEDYNYKIPVIKASIALATAPVQIIASCWSPPTWMKHVHNITGTSQLRDKFSQTYADYHLKFLESYARENLTIWALTTTNEPLSGIMSLGKANRLGWTTQKMGRWIANNFGPTIRNSSFSNIKIIAGDDQRFSLILWYNIVIQEVPEADKYIDGLAVHFYFDELSPPEILTKATEDHPDKFILATEASNGVGPTIPAVVLGSWDRAQKYIKDIIEDLNYNVVGWVDWNIALDEQGGPTYINNCIDSPIIVNAQRGEFVKQPMFYALGHFSKFLPRGSRRINVSATYPDSTPLDNVAFLTPRNTIVVVVYNEVDQTRAVRIRLGNQEAFLSIEPQSIATVEFPYSQAS